MDMESEIGKRIRIFRTSHGLTLQEVSEKTGLSPSYLSKVENSPKAPPVSTLIKITKALGVSMSSLFGENEDNRSFTLVRADQRRVISRDGTQFGYSYQPLAPAFADKQMEPCIVSLPTGLDEPPLLIQHEGQEMVFVLEGAARIHYGDSVHIIQEGDCVYFDSSVPHMGVSLGGKEAVALSVIWAPQK